jgi:hypothetical protein
LTLVHVALSVPAPDGTLAPADGILRFSPTARRSVGGVAVLPKPFQVSVVGGVADVTLEPSTVAWVWRIDEHIPGIPSRTIYAATTGATANYADLVPLDPDTLAPAATADPAWVAPYEELVARLETPAVIEDTSNPGLYLIYQGTKITADPGNPGLYLIGL